MTPIRLLNAKTCYTTPTESVIKELLVLPHASAAPNTKVKSRVSIARVLTSIENLAILEEKERIKKELAEEKERRRMEREVKRRHREAENKRKAEEKAKATST